MMPLLEPAALLPTTTTEEAAAIAIPAPQRSGMNRAPARAAKGPQTLDSARQYGVCDRLLDPETNRHCEFDGIVPVTADGSWRCPACGAKRRIT